MENESHVREYSNGENQKQTSNLHYLQPNAAMNEISAGAQQVSSSTQEGGEADMNNPNHILLEHLRQDMRDHKQEIRDRDARLQVDMQEREARYRQETREYKEEMREREERLMAAMQRQSDEVKEREERMLAVMSEFKVDTKNQINELKSETTAQISELKSETTAQISELKSETTAQINELKQSLLRTEDRVDAGVKHVQSMVTANFWGRIATVVALIAVAISIWAVVKPASEHPNTGQQQNAPATTSPTQTK